MADRVYLDEWLRELNELGVHVDSDTSAQTIEELYQETGRSRKWWQRKMREAIAAGLVEVVWRRYVRIDGRSTPVPAYRLVRKEKKKKGK